ncbi:ARM repeat superfamily protein, partial [Prunus dulcis]
EITLGIIGNLACHEVPMKHIVSTSGLIGTVVDQLFSEYAQCLCEACRLLTVGLQSSERISWAKELQSEHILSRILWIAENSLNPQLIEKSVELLLATIESSEEVVLILLPPLMKLGLASLLINLLDFEMSQLLSERVPERYPILDVILRSIEALSVIDGHSQEICSNKDLFRLVCDLVKLPDKVENYMFFLLKKSRANIRISMCVEVTAYKCYPFLKPYSEKLPSDSFGLITPHEVEVTLYIHPDLPFLQGLLDIFPFSSEDLEARSALWNIIARLLVRVQENEMSRSALQQYVSVLVSKSDVIEDDLLDSQLDELNSKARTTSLRRIICLLNQWTASKDDHKENEMMGNRHEDDINIDRLLDCCCLTNLFSSKWANKSIYVPSVYTRAFSGYLLGRRPDFGLGGHPLMGGTLAIGTGRLCCLFEIQVRFEDEEDGRAFEARGREYLVEFNYFQANLVMFLRTWTSKNRLESQRQRRNTISLDLQQEKEHKVVRTSLLKPKLSLQHHRGKAGTDGGTVNLPSHLIIQSTPGPV